MEKFPNVEKWLSRCKTNMKDYDEVNQAGLNKFKEMLKAMKK